MAQGDILAWLCADDEYEPGAIQKAVKGIIAGNDVVMGYSRFIDAGGNYLSEHPANVHPHYDHDMLLRFWKYGTISQPATFWTKKIWETCGPIKENLYFAMDYDLWLRMSQKTFFSHIDAYVAKYRIHPDAKCFSDNYGSRLELIEVSRNYWPARWKPGYWRLLFHYYFSYGGNTKHYADAEKRLNAAKENLDIHKRIKAILSFSVAHLIHPATPLMPGYKMVLKRILGEGVGPLWFWRFCRKVFYRLTRKTRIRLLAIKNISNSGETVILSVETIGYNNIKFRYWAKNDKEISLLKDWVAESTLIVTEDIDKYSEYGVHIKRDKDKDFIDQTWVSVH
jgi:glycosyltransferase involved in cell wall biosynthesis